MNKIGIFLPLSAKNVFYTDNKLLAYGDFVTLKVSKRIEKTIISIKVRDVMFGYGEESVVSDASFTVNKGEFVGIKGPSGSGKSTVLKLITGLYPVDDGKVTAKKKKMGISNQPGYLLVSAHYGNAGELVLKPGEYSDMIVDYVKVYSCSED